MWTKLSNIDVCSISSSRSFVVEGTSIIINTPNNQIKSIYAKITTFYCRQHTWQHSNSCQEHQQYTQWINKVNLSKNINICLLAAYMAVYINNILMHAYIVVALQSTSSITCINTLTQTMCYLSNMSCLTSSSCITCSSNSTTVAFASFGTYWPRLTGLFSLTSLSCCSGISCDSRVSC